MTNKYEYEQDEPFGWYDGMGFSTNKNDFGKAISTAIPLYTHPAPAIEQEPVAWDVKLREWNDCTGALPSNGSWFWEIVAMLEEASKTHPAPEQNRTSLLSSGKI